MAKAKEPKTLDELFHDTLKDIYYAEKKIRTALSQMAQGAQSADPEKHGKQHHQSCRPSPTQRPLRELDRVV